MARNATAATNVSTEMTLNTSAWRMNGMSRRIRKNSMVASCGFAMRWCRGAVARDQPRLAGEAAAVSGFQICPIDRLGTRFMRPYQRLTRPREKNTAENMEVRMPRQ